MKNNIQDRRRTRKLGKMALLLLVIGFLCYIFNPVRQTGDKVEKRENRAVSVPVDTMQVEWHWDEKEHHFVAC